MMKAKKGIQRWVIFLACCVFVAPVIAQVGLIPALTVRTEKEGNGHVIYANNKEHIAVSLVMEYQLQNMQSQHPAGTVFVVPARTENFVVDRLDPIQERGRFGFNFKYRYTWGDLVKAQHDSNQVYLLPFAAGKIFRVYQGYNGTLSHQNEKALDFTMPVGTVVHAARAGVVFQLEDKNNQGCGNETCKTYNNYINILHDDGSIANYSHLQLNGVLCQLGQRVNAGDRIGFSGNTGWSTGPHLHFTVFLPQFGKGISQDTYFNINGQKTLLKEGGSYSR